MSRPGARVPSSALYICPTALHTAFYSVVQCYWTYALSLVWQGRIGRSEAHSAMLESRHRRDGPISLTTAVEARCRVRLRSAEMLLAIPLVQNALRLVSVTFHQPVEDVHGARSLRMIGRGVGVEAKGEPHQFAAGQGVV